jgi:hypothetical protein
MYFNRARLNHGKVDPKKPLKGDKEMFSPAKVKIPEFAEVMHLKSIEFAEFVSLPPSLVFSDRNVNSTFQLQLGYNKWPFGLNVEEDEDDEEDGPGPSSVRTRSTLRLLSSPPKVHVVSLRPYQQMQALSLEPRSRSSLRSYDALERACLSYVF